MALIVYRLNYKKIIEGYKYNCLDKHEIKKRKIL